MSVISVCCRVNIFTMLIAAESIVMAPPHIKLTVAALVIPHPNLSQDI